ncbi:DUF389 domain-containing protein [Oscillatoria sp. FACHB-1407]|uniref:DUF389 domain-containing protein n=1 Tax=Oscillatoria sp. FACHB-1407 TaxID=2692847 RepID=UPI0016826BA6|nr:DUF389 domain-containing protein [Oscillatoria sp. FACHB-1407]MBD2465491.1 DUF389 domain-containing protein [Oscillatoria sp. FACHB-1407]
MRQLIIQVPRGCGKKVFDLATTHQGVNLSQTEAMSGEDAIDLVTVHLPNRAVEEFLEQIQDLPDVHTTLLPSGVIALRPPADEAPEQVKQVQVRSPIEVFLSGLQSVGSWTGFLSYAAVAGVVVWIGLYTNTSYLLVAAMLIAPFASPAMNTAIATARGDWHLLWRSILRYFAALMVTILVAGGLSLILRQAIATTLIVERSQISTVAVLLPLAAGAAGAINLVQSERSSLVSGAATGMLVAASLAPPAGIVGMATAIGRWDMVINGLFLLLLQLFGINVSAALLFRLYGLSVRESRYSRGKKGVFPIAVTVTAIALAGLLTWQFSSPPELERSSRAQRANAEIQDVIQQEKLADLVEANIRFTRPSIPGQNTLLCVVYVQRAEGVTLPSEEIRSRLTEAIQTRLRERGFNVTPLVDVSVLEPPNRNP